MANINLNLTVLLFENEVSVWHNYDEDSEEPETVTTLADLFDGYAEDLKGGFGYVEAEIYVQETIKELDKGKALLLATIQEMKDKEY